MNSIEFFSRRFETELKGPLQFGDEVIDSFNDKGIVVREPYKVGSDNHWFTLLYYGRHLASCRVEDLKKTGKSYAKELNTIFEGLKAGGSDNG